ncbi:uncharacterized protein A4U43_C07F34400 [Asparagus officinalis]|uniref:Uncharacterized protein n=1 Tax=Asparagus officinalis TaxID=4686 RepID=A0A5P1EK45_ASPOF|nr:uncharacterized protein A4U43_C07F34400 [Asparagus officinalis]
MVFDALAIAKMLSVPIVMSYHTNVPIFWMICMVAISRCSQVSEGDSDDGYDSDTKVKPTYYPEGWYMDEDGQLSWFNAGVRVGVGIGLGMCVGLGIGVGLLMSSYQATTRSFKRRFF